MKVAIIGGGASGLIASIFARQNGAEVTIFERNLECGKKILVTGNGRCNYWNEDQDVSHYHSSHSSFLESFFEQEIQEKVLEFFSSIGILPKIKNGYYYPYSNQATSVRNALVFEAKRLGVTIQTNYLVDSVSYQDSYFSIHPSKENVLFDKVILTTGGKAAFKTGSTGIGYDIAQNFGHTILFPKPSLVQLVSSGSFLKNWAGVRCEAIVSIYQDGEFLKEEAGEIQLTDYGISGICVFNLSRYASILLEEGKDIIVKINFLPFLKESVSLWLSSFSEEVKGRNLEELLEGILPYKLTQVLLKEANIDRNSRYSELSFDEKERLGRILTEFSLPIRDTKDFSFAQTTVGGISLKEVNPRTMESLKQKGLYFAGEILDVDGDCGGYNLGFAWMSGMVAGKSSALEGEKNDTCSSN